MKFQTTTLIVLSLFLFSLNFAMAQDINIVTPVGTIDTYGGQKNLITITITNEHDPGDTFFISVWPSDWVTLERYWVQLDGGESKSLSMTIEPPRDVEEGVYVFSVNVRSIETNSSGSANMFLNMKREEDIILSEVKTNKQILRTGELLTIQPVITNFDSKRPRQAFVTTKILRGGLAIRTFEEIPIINPKGTITLTHTFPIVMSHIYGDYEIKVELRDSLNRVIDEKETEFKIEKVENIVKDKRTEYGFLYSRVIIRVKNNGNAPFSGYSISESFPAFSRYFFYPEIEPTSEKKKDNKIIYTWSFDDLGIGETKTVEYQFRFLSVFLIALFLTAGLWGFSVLFFRPVLAKKYYGILGPEKEMTISLHVKNNFRKVLKDVIVKDSVPSLARVVRKFDTLTPEIKRKDTGTELTWKIKKLKPREERILTYRIKPIIEIVGDLKLPKAHFMYESRKGRVKRVASKTIIVKGRVE